MKRARFTEDQIIGVLKEHEAGAKTADLARKHGVSEATLYNWKAKYGGMDVSEAKRLKQLEDENAKLKKLLAEQMLDAAALRELLSKWVGPAVKREGVAHLRATMGLSERRACSIVSADRKMVRYRSCGPPDTELRTQLRDLANERKRFGDRRLFVLLRQEGEPSGINRIYRLYRRRRPHGAQAAGSEARAVGSRAPRSWSNPSRTLAGRWTSSMTKLACGRRHPASLNIVDDVTRECLAAIPEHLDLRSARVARELDGVDQTARQARHDRVRQWDRVFTSNCHVRLGAGQQGRSGISLRQESRCRTASARVSTGACATSFSTRACSSASIMPGPRSRTGSTITATSGTAALGAGLSHTGEKPMPPISPQHAIGSATPEPAPRRSHVAPPAPHGLKPAEALIAFG